MIDSSTATAGVTVTKAYRFAPEQVFDAWLDPAMVSYWFAPSLGEMVRVDTDAREGGRFRLDQRRGGEIACHWGIYQKIERPVRLVFTWNAGDETEARAQADDGSSVVTIDLLTRTLISRHSACLSAPVARRMPRHNIFATPFAKVYPMYVQKAGRKNRTKEEVDQVISWLTGYDQAGLQQQIDDQNDFETFFAQAPAIHSNSSLIKGVVCGVRVEEVEDPLMQKIRYLDKLIDELAKGKKMEKILRQ